MILRSLQLPLVPVMLFGLGCGTGQFNWERPTTSTSGTGTTGSHSSTTGSRSSSSSGSTTSSISTSTTGSSGTSGSTASSGTSSSSAASSGSGATSTGSGTGSTGTTKGSTTGSTGSTGTTGHELDGGLDIDGGGAYHAAPLNPTVYWCAVLDGGLTQADGGGCEPQLPACAGTALPLEYAIHVAEPTPVIYDATYPPASGPHWPCWEAWGPTHALLPPMRFVHNLEHGGVVFVVQCLADAGPTDCESRLQPASDFATADGPVAPLGDRRYVVLPSFEATHAYTALAWGWRLELDAWDRDVFACFASAHLGQGPENFAVDPDLNACPQSFQP